MRLPDKSNIKVILVTLGLSKKLILVFTLISFRFLEP